MRVNCKCVQMNLLEYEWERRCMCEWVWTREACVCECLHMSLHGRQWRTCLQRKWHTSPILWILTVNRQEDQIKMHRGNVDMSTFSLPRTVNEESENTYLYYNTLQHTATHCNTLQHHDNIGISSYTWVCVGNGMTYISSLQHNATQCNTLQHTATHCNTHSKLGKRWQTSP